MSKFTQGKWKATYSEVLKALQGHEAIIHTGEFINGEKCDGDYIAMVHTMADARAIAAVPEMYKALEELIPILESDDRLSIAYSIKRLLARIDGTEE